MKDKILSAFTSVKDFLAKWWFLASTLIIAVMYYLLDSQGKKVRELHNEVQLLKLNSKLQELKTNADKSETEFQKANTDYDTLKRQHPELFKRVLKNSGK